MKKLLLITVLSLAFSFESLARSVYKVSGSKVYFRTKGISVRKGKTYSVKSDGYEVGSIKVIKVSGSKGIGKIVDGYISVGDKVSGRKKKKRSYSRKRGKKSRRRGKNKYSAIGHFAMNFLGEQSDNNEAPAAQFDTQMGLNFRFTGPLSKSMSYGLNLLYSSGTLTLPAYTPTDPNQSSYLESTLDSTFWELAFLGKFHMGRYFYLMGGLGWANVSGAGTIQTSATTSSSYDATYRGYSFLGGLGTNISFTKSIFAQGEFHFRYINFTSANINSPSQSGTFAVEDVSQTGYTLLIGIGMYF